MSIGELISKAEDISLFLDRYSTEELLKRKNEILQCCTSSDKIVKLPHVTELVLFLNSLSHFNILVQADSLATKLKSVTDDTKDEDSANVNVLPNDLIDIITRTQSDIHMVSLHRNITKLLERVEYSLNGLKDLSVALLTPSSFFTYGPSGYLIGLEMYCLLMMFAEQHREDDDLKTCVATIDLIPLIQLDTLRAGANMALDFAKEQGFREFQVKEQTREEEGNANNCISISYCNSISNNSNSSSESVWASASSSSSLIAQWADLVTLTAPLSAEHVKGLQQLSSSYGLSFLALVYTKTHVGRGQQSVTDYLNCVSMEQSKYENWSRVVDFICSEHVINPLHKKPKPVLPQSGITYGTLVSLHGALVEDSLEFAITQLRRHGFAGFFDSLPRAMAADIDIFIHVAELLPFHRFQIEDLDPLWGEHVVILSKYFLDSLVNDLHAFWEEQYDPGQPHGGSSFATLTPLMAEVIRLRAFLELCHRHSQYLVFPYNIPSDLYYGILDYPRGLVQLTAGIYGMFTKPPGSTREELKRSLPQDFDSALSIAKSTLYHHPLRFMTSMAVTDARGGNVAKWLEELSEEEKRKARRNHNDDNDDTTTTSSGNDNTTSGSSSSSSGTSSSVAAVATSVTGSNTNTNTNSNSNSIRSIGQVNSVTDLFHFVKNIQ